MSKQRHLLLIAGFLLMTAPAGVSQVNTAKPGEPVERHLSSDQTFREWSHDSNSTDKTKLIKVCRAENVCKMRYREGQTPRTRVRKLVAPLRYEDENTPISDAFTSQVRQALDNLRDKRGVTVRFIGYTDDAPLTGLDESTYGNHLSLSKARAHDESSHRGGILVRRSSPRVIGRAATVPGRCRRNGDQDLRSPLGQHSTSRARKRPADHSARLRGKPASRADGHCGSDQRTTAVYRTHEERAT